MNDYRIDKIYKEMEDTLIASLKRNLGRHSTEEKKVGFQFTQWQAAKLKELKRYQRQNKKIIGGYVEGLDKEVSQMLQYELKQGKLDALKNYKKALALGYKNSKRVSDSFFTTNDKKVNALIKVVNNDLKKANHAALRMINDDYRQVIHKASMYVSNGVFTEKQAIDNAIKEFSIKGINCIEYSNGSRHKISNYASMAVRTANTRAYLMGEGEFRKRIGETLIIMSKHGTACELCQPFEGKVLIDDVYSGGSSKDGNYMLLSTAMKQGLYHPNCRHGHGTYYKDLGIEESKEIIVNDENPAPEVPSIKTVDKSFKNVSLKGIDPSYQTQIKNHMETIINKYPIDISNTEFITNTGTRNIGYAQNSFSAKWDSKLQKYKVKYLDKLTLSNKKYKNSELSKEAHIRTKNHFKKPYDNEFSTLWHEYAHQIDYKYAITKNPELAKLTKNIPSLVGRDERELFIKYREFNNLFSKNSTSLMSDTVQKRLYEEMVNKNPKYTRIMFSNDKATYLGTYSLENKLEFLAEGFTAMNTIPVKEQSDFVKMFAKVFNDEFDKVMR